ncbi:unnamed protein product, partial [Didymodactylos carnosus]
MYTAYKPISKPIQLYKPIYVARESYFSDYMLDASFEKDDEFEFIANADAYSVQDEKELILKHLRTFKTICVKSSLVQEDHKTPLRLGVRDRGIVECCLMKNIRTSYLIRYSSIDEKAYVLSVNQSRDHKDTLPTHYVIRVNKQNNCFYLAHESKLRHYFFPTFRKLVQHPKILEKIQLSRPIARRWITDEDAIWRIDFNELNIEAPAGGFAWWEMKNSPQPVEVNIRKFNTSGEFSLKIDVIKNVRHANLVAFYGLCWDPKANETLIVTEYMSGGDLKTWLEKASSLPTREILNNFCLQISRGMAYLERCNQFHGDLRCKNILVKGELHEALLLKIANYGSAMRNATSNLQRESAPEIFKNQEGTIKSDIWSFAISMTVMWKKGQDAYTGMSFEALKQHMKSNKPYVLMCPPSCPRAYYDNIIQVCLRQQQELRPTFAQLVNVFKRILYGVCYRSAADGNTVDSPTEVINSIIQDGRSFKDFHRPGMLNFLKKAIPGFKYDVSDAAGGIDLFKDEDDAGACSIIFSLKVSSTLFSSET